MINHLVFNWYFIYLQSLTPLHYSAMRGNDDAATDLLQIPSTNLEVSKNFLSKIQTICILSMLAMMIKKWITNT